MAEIAIAGTVVPAVVSFVAPVFVEFVKKKTNERKESLTDIHEVLNKGLEELLALKEDKNREVSSNSEQKDPSVVYETWENRVSKIQGEVTPLNVEYDTVKERKPILWINPQSQIEKKIKKALKEVIELLGQCPQNVLVDKLPEQVIEEEIPENLSEGALEPTISDLQVSSNTHV